MSQHRTEPEVYVVEDESEIGSRAPFYATYRGDDDVRYGWFCANCGSMDAAVDTMERIVCNQCGNTHRPSQWDAAYL